MYKFVYVALLLAASCDAFISPKRPISQQVSSRATRFPSFRMSEEPQAEVADPMDDAMEEVDEETKKQLEKMRRAQELREQEVAASKKKRELSRELRKDIRKIENKIKNWNIAGVPAAVVLIGILHLIIRRRKISAR